MIIYLFIYDQGFASGYPSLSFCSSISFTNLFSESDRSQCSCLSSFILFNVTGSGFISTNSFIAIFVYFEVVIVKILSSKILFYNLIEFNKIK